ncbi:hypothetical protein [uncultured Azohydromonas sp.]|jgi:hypothetical protein|uniref:hypothetical protein n=1 Tax=uncultured Azohydromonas sp. TaxID=487342 RepID=UPI0026031F7D|nr:hypothetical protein [uncultured Azohydromonas sp.]
MQIPPFEARSYSGLASTPLGQKLWNYLNRPESVLRMQAASDLERPALQALEEGLLQEFGDKVMDDRVKQMIGAMTRQVMERVGYVWVRNNVPLAGVPFSRASKYRRRDLAEFHVWRASDDPRRLALSLVKAGAQLPACEAGRWLYWKSLDGEIRVVVGLGIADIGAAKRALAEQGCHLHTMPCMLSAP